MPLHAESLDEAPRAYQESPSLTHCLRGSACQPRPIASQCRGSQRSRNLLPSCRAVRAGFRARVFKLAVVLEDQADKSGALTFAEALKRDPDFREAHCNLAQLYEQLGRRRDAVRHYAAAKRLTR